MEISGTVTISLKDYSQLRKLANRGSRTLSVHQELLDKMGRFASSVVYDSDLPDKSAEKVVEHLRLLARSTPGINFYHDRENNRVLLKMEGEDI